MELHRTSTRQFHILISPKPFKRQITPRSKHSSVSPPTTSCRYAENTTSVTSAALEYAKPMTDRTSDNQVASRDATTGGKSASAAAAAGRPLIRLNDRAVDVSLPSTRQNKVSRGWQIPTATLHRAGSLPALYSASADTHNKPANSPAQLNNYSSSMVVISSANKPVSIATT